MPRSAFPFVADVFEVHSQPNDHAIEHVSFGCSLAVASGTFEPRTIGAYTDASNPKPVPPDFDDDV